MVAFELADTRVQERLEKQPFHQWVFPDGVAWTSFYRTRVGYLLRFPDLADFLVSQDGREVRCHAMPGVTHQTVSHLYENQVLPLALSRQGKLVLHASAVEIAVGGVAFIAESGRGKSTLAASFATNGCRFLTDDGLVIEEGDDGYLLLPSHPSIRLWEDSQAALVPTATPVSDPAQYTSKVRFLAGGDMTYCSEPRPLRRIYFLGDGESADVAIGRIGASNAFVELVRHSFLLDIEARELAASHFDRLSRLVNQVSYDRLDYPRRFDVLPRVRDAIVGHCTQRTNPY